MVPVVFALIEYITVLMDVQKQIFHRFTYETIKEILCPVIMITFRPPYFSFCKIYVTELEIRQIKKLDVPDISIKYERKSTLVASLDETTP